MIKEKIDIEELKNDPCRFIAKYVVRIEYVKPVNIDDFSVQVQKHTIIGQIIEVAETYLKLFVGVYTANIPYGYIRELEIMNKLSPDTKPQTCPVCGGRGFVRFGFYGSHDVEPFISNGGMNVETCRSCHGKGYIQEYEL